MEALEAFKEGKLQVAGGRRTLPCARPRHRFIAARAELRIAARPRGLHPPHRPHRRRRRFGRGGVVRGSRKRRSILPDIEAAEENGADRCRRRLRRDYVACGSALFGVPGHKGSRLRASRGQGNGIGSPMSSRSERRPPAFNRARERPPQVNARAHERLAHRAKPIRAVRHRTPPTRDPTAANDPTAIGAGKSASVPTRSIQTSRC